MAASICSIVKSGTILSFVSRLACLKVAYRYTDLSPSPFQIGHSVDSCTSSPLSKS